MFKIIVLAGCATLLLHASQAQAGRSIQGVAVNGRSIQGVAVNGRSIQGVAVNGRSVQGVAVNGVRTNEADASERLRVIGIELPETAR
jgi:hypothetical protein